MMDRNPVRTAFNIIVFTVLAVCFARMFTACASTGKSGGAAAGTENNHTRETKRPSALTVQSPQDTIYNGRAQPVSFVYAGEDTPEVIYFRSPDAREAGMGGSHAAPAQAGVYYVLIRCEYEEAFVEYRVRKCPVKIETAETQSAFYNGNPKRVDAVIVPPVPVSYSYYPKQELRDAAIKAAMETAQGENSEASLATVFKGYRRIDSAPTEQGSYFVWIYFAGDENHESASAEVEFIILPPQG